MNKDKIVSVNDLQWRLNLLLWYYFFYMKEGVVYFILVEHPDTKKFAYFAAEYTNLKH